MHILDFKKKIYEIEKLKKEKDFSFSKLSELFKLPSVSETWIK